MPETGHIYALASEIAGMVRREGRHDFKHMPGGHDCSAASLCGLCVHTDGGTLLRIHSADLDIEFSIPANEPAQGFPRFRRGSPADLKSWHKRLGGLHAFLTPMQKRAA